MAPSPSDLIHDRTGGSPLIPSYFDLKKVVGW